MKKIVLWIAACLFIFTSVKAVHADDLPVLSLDSAVKRAEAYSIELAKIRRAEELNNLKLEQAANGDSYKAYQQQYLENEYNDLQEGVQEKVIAYDMAKLFDEILLNEAKFKNLEDSLKLSSQNLETLKFKYEKGTISKTKLDETLLANETALNNKSQLEDTINTQYAALCKTIGAQAAHYKLQKDTLIYQPFEIVGDLEGVLSSKAEQNLSVWKAVETAKMNQNIDYAALEKSGSSYLTYLEMQENLVQQQETSQTTKDQFVSSLRSKYTQLLQLQEKYNLQQKQLQAQSNQLQTKEKKYRAGFLSKTEYQNAKQSYEEAKTALQDIVVQQEYIRQVIENPYLL